MVSVAQSRGWVVVAQSVVHWADKLRVLCSSPGPDKASKGSLVVKVAEHMEPCIDIAAHTTPTPSAAGTDPNIEEFWLKYWLKHLNTLSYSYWCDPPVWVTKSKSSVLAPITAEEMAHPRAPSPQQAETTTTPEMLCPNHLLFHFLENHLVRQTFNSQPTCMSLCLHHHCLRPLCNCGLSSFNHTGSWTKNSLLHSPVLNRLSCHQLPPTSVGAGVVTESCAQQVTFVPFFFSLSHAKGQPKWQIEICWSW